jgi:hypothetical protein
MHRTYAPAWWSRSTATSAPRASPKGMYRSSGSTRRERVTLENERGKRFEFRP